MLRKNGASWLHYDLLRSIDSVSKMFEINVTDDAIGLIGRRTVCHFEIYTYQIENIPSSKVKNGIIKGVIKGLSSL